MEVSTLAIVLGAIVVVYGQLAWLHYRLGRLEGKMKALNDYLHSKGGTDDRRSSGKNSY